MRKERRYSYKDVDMLIAARTLCDNFENHKAEITAVRSIWADPFIGDFRTRINAAINTYLGSDPKKDLRLATQALKNIQADATKAGSRKIFTKMQEMLLTHKDILLKLEAMEKNRLRFFAYMICGNY